MKAFLVSVQIRASWRELHWLNVFDLQHLSESWAELAVPIHEHVPLTVQETVKGVGKISGNLLHPQLVGARRTASKVNTTNLHHE